MAHFYGGVHGNRGKATRLGTKNSGLRIFGNGWHIGISANIDYDSENKRDVVSVYISNGSNGGGHNMSIGDYTIRDGQIVKI